MIKEPLTGINLSALKEGDIFAYKPTADCRTTVVRNSGDSGLVIVEQWNGQLTAEDENRIVYILGGNYG